MHATLEQLLMIRDGEPCKAAQHVAQCAQCQAHVSALDVPSSYLFLEAEVPPPVEGWKKIQARIQSSTDQTSKPQDSGSVLASISKWHSLSSALYALSIAVVFTGVATLYSSQRQSDLASQNYLAMQNSIQALKDNSRGLEQVLQKVEARQSDLLTGKDQLAAERLYWQLMMVDQEIQESSRTQAMDNEQMRLLWEDRVNALTQLNQLYYANQSLISDTQF